MNYLNSVIESYLEWTDFSLTLSQEISATHSGKCALWKVEVTKLGELLTVQKKIEVDYFSSGYKAILLVKIQKAQNVNAYKKTKS